MSGFEDALQQRLARNAELADERAQVEVEMDQAAERKREEAERRERELVEAQREHHAELAVHLQQLTAQLVAAGDPRFVVRSGWTASGEEFLTKVTTRQTRPARSLYLELDRDDDEVLARWHSDLGDSLELYHLLEFTTDMQAELVLQVVDDELWSDRERNPPFPGNPD